MAMGLVMHYFSCYLASPNLQPNAGSVYVVYGSKAIRTIDLLTLQPSEGFYIYGANAYDKIGYAIASAGDINNDGFFDIALSSPIASPNERTNAGIVYIIYGNKLQSNIDLFLGINVNSNSNANRMTKIHGANAGDFLVIQ